MKKNNKVKRIDFSRKRLGWIADKYYNAKDVFFIGRNIDYTSSLEGSLKLKEISYIHSEAYAAGELKHGTISLIDEGMLVISLCTLKQLVEKTVSNIKEVKARGAFTVLITSLNVPCDSADTIIDLSTSSQIEDIFASVIVAQILSYEVALNRGCDIDKPRNLAKSVTVE